MRHQAAVVARGIGLPKLADRLKVCGEAAFRDPELRMGVTATGEARAFMSGVVTCSSVWACPSCAAKLARRRAAELNAGLASARAQGRPVALLTLTVAHGRRDDLAELLTAIRAAVSKLRRSRKWRALPLAGTVAATEVTYSDRAGFHPHLHLLAFGLPGMTGAEFLAALEAMRGEWVKFAGLAGLVADVRHGFDVQDGSAAGRYVAGFGPGEEVALGTMKLGRGDSRTPMELLRDAAEDGCKRSARLFGQYLRAFHGRCQLVWSHGLRDLLSVPDGGEEVAPEDELREVQTVRTWVQCSAEWREARKRIVALLRHAELGLPLDAAEYGPTDAEQWRRLRSRMQSQVIEPWEDGQ
jgi:hypothetical protein